MYEGSRIGSYETMDDIGIMEGGIIYAIIEQRGGKPVIYLLPPAAGPSLEATVDLSLSAPWSLSAIYPLQPGLTRHKSIYGQSTSWTVRAESNGVLYDKGSNTEVSYLYWEALYVFYHFTAL